MSVVHRQVKAAADEALMVRVQDGDAKAFGVLYDALAAEAFRLAGALARDRSRSEEIVQEAFLSVWRSRASYRAERGTVPAWVLATVRHRALDSLRRNGGHDARRAEAEHLEATPLVLDSVEDIVGERDQAARLRSALAQLPAAQREVIALAYFGELTTAEIAQHLDLPLGTVKGRMRLGLEKLRETGR